MKKFDNLIDKLIESYDSYDFTNEDKTYFLDKNKIISIFDNLKLIVNPKFYKKPVQESDKFPIRLLITKTYDNLKEQIRLAMLYDTKRDLTNIFEEEVEKICDKFFNQLPYITSLLKTDIDATFNNDPAAESKSQIVHSYPGISAITYYRLAHELNILGVPFIPRIVTEYAHSITGIDIHPGAKIGKSFCIDHGTGIVIGETTIIGENVKIYQGVTLGALSIKDRLSTLNKKRHPTIENNVTIYAGVTILGGNTIIGENSIIGGSAFITESIPKNSKVSVEIPKLKVKTK